MMPKKVAFLTKSQTFVLVDYWRERLTLNLSRASCKGRAVAAAPAKLKVASSVCNHRWRFGLNMVTMRN